jgi:hypothetical protein
MTATETIGAGLTFEKVWAAIQATDKQIKETTEQMKETDELMKAVLKESRANGRQLGHLHNRFGDMVEHMVAPNLLEKFRKLGLVFDRIHKNSKIQDRENRVIAEIDVFLDNGDRAMAVEVKVKPVIEDIDRHLRRMEKLRAYADRTNDRRIYLGAMAGMIFGDSEKTYALGKGLYVIEPSGDTYNIIEPHGDYHPHEWRQAAAVAD